MPRHSRHHRVSSPFLSEEALDRFPAHDPIKAYLQESDDEELSDDEKDDEKVEFADTNTPSIPEVPSRHRPLKEDYEYRPRPKAAQKNYLLIYYVECSRQGIHKKHERSTAYRDHPMLFKGDSKISALRGKKEILDIERYLKSGGPESFIVKKTFKCFDYHEQMQSVFDPLPRPKNPELPGSVQPYFFSLRRNCSPAIPFTETIDVLSEPLRDAIATVTGMSTGQVAKLDNLQYMDMLRQLLYHYRRLRNDQAFVLDPIQLGLLDDLLEYMKQSNELEYEEADKLISQGLITQRHLAKLCGPNEIVVGNVDGQPRAYRVSHLSVIDPTSLKLDLWYWEFNGAFYKSEDEQRVLAWPDSVSAEKAIPISSLELYPLRLAPPELEQRLKARGEIFWQFRKAKFIAYDPPNATLEIHTTNPRYMVDAKTYQQMHGSLESSLVKDDLGSEVMEKDTPPNMPFAILLPHKIIGFAFTDKKWRSLLIERIREIDWNESAFDRLVMQNHKKELIKALVTVHTTSTKSTDIIEGKGNALIMLLHGGPGTGKTLTAESIAELTRKPLYRVTCGDIGTNADEVEKYLQSVLLLGTIWGCVVLLDEADVFLEERRETDLQRNALVSVFLRVLEYYDGILILTSNRIGTFDSAFKSRFQLAVHYPALDVKGRYEIWLNFINGLSKTEPNVDIDDLKSRIDDLAGIELNGRQIRNTVRTALQLAYFRGETLNYQHFDRVIKVVDEFEKHIETTRGFPEVEWLRHQGTRPE